MVKEIIIALIVGYVLFEVIEHVVFPLVWSFLQRKKGSMCDLSSMVGKTGEVKHWRHLQGKIFIAGETWNAKSDHPLIEGDEAIIEKVEGFVLTVKKVPSVHDSGRTN
jgi:membrane-bound serine protease (ClpP class)